jgi:hypothetical protein
MAVIATPVIDTHRPDEGAEQKASMSARLELPHPADGRGIGPSAVKTLAFLDLGDRRLAVTAADLKCSKARAGPSPHGTTATVDRLCCVIPLN